MNIIEILTSLLIFSAGVGIIISTGNIMVKNASALGRSLGVNPILIGLTIVSFGTSIPEFLVCLFAAFQGSSDIATGNIVGSNIANIGLILGFTAAVRPVTSNMSLLRVEVPMMILLTIVLYTLSLNLTLGRIEGLVIFMILPVFVIYSYFSAKSGTKKMGVEIKPDTKPSEKLKQIILILVGLAGLIIGAKLVVDESIYMARLLGISELIIGITAVAIGTSLPELSASLIAIYKNEHELVVGNVIGSNIFNIGILGLVSLIQPIEINSELLKIEYPVMLLLSLLTLPIMKTGTVITRKEGVILLSIYIIFIYLVIL